jgi:hypothetical protein
MALPDIPDARINTIDPSPHDPATAYAAATRFQFNDYTPYFFKTSDYGATWTRIGASLPHGGWARVIREDPVRRGLLYAGTELGVFVSLNDGADWQPLQNGLPVTPIYDLVVHPQGDLVVATGGRAFWILDDVSPLRQANATIAGSAVLYRPRPAYRSHLAGGGEPQGGATSGQNAPTGALLNFHLPRATSATIEIVDAAGTVIRQVSPAGGPNRRSADELRAGMNRVSWDLRQTGIPTLNLGGGPGAGRVEGKLVRPGTYTVRLTADATVLTAPLEVRSMPDVRVTDADYAAQEQLLGRIEGVLLEYRRLAQQVESVTDQIAERTNGRTDPALLEAARAYSARLEMPALIYRSLAYIHSRVNAIVPAVRQSQLELFGTLQQDWEAERTVIQQALGAELTAFNAVLARFGLPTIEPAVEPAGSNGT